MSVSNKKENFSKIKINLETKFIKDLKKEYEEKIKKAKEKENAKLERLHKELSLSILENCIGNEAFKNKFLELIKDENNIKKIYDDLISFYI